MWQIIYPTDCPLEGSYVSQWQLSTRLCERSLLQTSAMESTEVERFTEKQMQGLVPQVRGCTTQAVLDCLLWQNTTAWETYTSKKHILLTLLEALRASQHPCWFANGLLSSYSLMWLKGERTGSLVSSYKGTDLILRSPCWWPHLNLTASQSPYLLIRHLGSIWEYIIWGYINIWPITGP